MLNGEYVVVEQVQHELLESPVAIYNFEVEGFHTYYVGDTEVLVHNDCESFNFNGRKSEAYAAKRGWTNDAINEAVSNGRIGTSINKSNFELCTVYGHPTMPGQYVVIENKSRSIVQLSNLKDPYWILDPEIILDP